MRNATSDVGSAVARSDRGFESRDPLEPHFLPEELGRLYTAYRSRVYFICLRMTGNHDEAEDLTQETFLRLLQKIDTFRHESSFYTWLRRLAINVVLLRFERPSWRRETSLDALASPDASSDSSFGMQFGTTDRDLMAVPERIDLERALDRMPPGFKAVLEMHDVKGYGHEEISQRMRASVGTSKSQLHKARAKMRGLLKEPRCGDCPNLHLRHCPTNCGPGVAPARTAETSAPLQ